MDRRSFLRKAAGTAVVSQLRTGAASAVFTPKTGGKGNLPPGLTEMLEREALKYMAAMNAPGMGFCLTDLRGHNYVAGYGLEELDTRKPLRPDRLFQIGSISKSMAVVLALQLVDEGKLDLHRPVMEYLPWLPWETPYGAVTAHHVFTHTTGMPGNGPLFFAEGGWKHRQRYAPGQRYFYSNMAFNTIGHMVAKLDGRTYQESLLKRLFEPLGMASTLPRLGGPEWELQAESYIPAAPDRPYLRFDKLRTAPLFHEETSAGCVASQPADMSRYLRFLLRGGVADGGRRLLSEESFRIMTHRWVGAEEFGPTAGYGYGIAVVEDGGDRILLHTGGMVSFMSSIYLNLSAGTAAFASINAQQGYRPTAVTRFAATALKTVQAGASPGATGSIEVSDPAEVRHAGEYAGTYKSGAGQVIEVDALGTRLHLHAQGKVFALLEGGADRFLIGDETLGASSWRFDRNAKGEITGVGHGVDFYLRDGASSSTGVPPRWQAFVGDYVNDDPWVLSVAVRERNGKLYLDDDVFLPVGAPDGKVEFFVESVEGSPDRVQFTCAVDGTMRMLLLNGTELRRFQQGT